MTHHPKRPATRDEVLAELERDVERAVRKAFRRLDGLREPVPA